MMSADECWKSVNGNTWCVDEAIFSHLTTSGGLP